MSNDNPIGDVTIAQAMRITQPAGWRDVLRVIDDVRSGEIESPEQLAEAFSLHGFNFLIRHRLDAIYPADIFGGTTRVYPSWSSEHGGEDIERGVRWVLLMRTALDELGLDYRDEAGPHR